MRKRNLLFGVCLAAMLLLLCSCAALADESYGKWSYTVNDSGQAIITAYNGYDADVDLAWNINGYTVVEIGEAAFMGNQNIQSVKLPIGVSIIRMDAFRNCESLQTVQLPSRLSTIEDGAFLGCTSLLELELPEMLSELGEEGCFEQWTKLIVAPDSDISGYAEAFGLTYEEKEADVSSANGERKAQATPVSAVCNEEDYQYKIKSGGAVIAAYIGNDSKIIIPSELGGYPVTVIGENAFSSCYNVESVIVPEGVIELERVAFRYCWELTSIQLPSTLRTIGDNAFYRCELLEEIEIPEGVTELGDRAFRGCIALSKVTLPSSISKISHYTFMECDEHLTIYGYTGSAADKYAKRWGYTFKSID